MDYENHNQQAVNTGLNLRDAPDKLEEGQWRRLTNIRSLSEGSITSRPGRRYVAGIATGSRVHTLFKLNDVIVVGSGARLYRNASTYPTNYNGQPISWVRHRNTAGEDKWAYVTDGDTMHMIASDGSDIKWGITEPNAKAEYADAGTGNLNSSAAGAIVYDWRYTYYCSRTGAESNPSPVQSGIALVSKKALVNGRASLDGQVDTVKFYRRGGLNGGDVWRFIGSTGNPGVDPTTGQSAFVPFEDNFADATIALNPALETDNFVPFTSVDREGNALYEAPVPYIWGPLDGKYIFGCGDPNRPGHVYWTNPGRPHSSNVSNHIAVTSPDEPLLGGFVYGGQSFCWSRENLYVLEFAGPDAVPVFTPSKTFCGRGLSLPYAFAVGPLIWFFSKDGLYVTDGQSPAEPFTEPNIRPLFNPQVENRDFTAPGQLKPILWPDFAIPVPSPENTVNLAMRLNYGGQFLHCHYLDTDSKYIHLLNHLPYGRWSNDQSTGASGEALQEVMSYYDEEQPNTGLLIGMSNGLVALETGTYDFASTNKIQCRARTGSNDLKLPQTLKEFGNIILDLEVSDATVPAAHDPLQPTGIAMIPLLNAETETLTYQRLLGTGATPLARQKVPRNFATSNSGEDVFAYSLGFDLQWNGNATVFAWTLQWRPDEESITRWEFPPTTHGLRGWQHVRDLYFTMRTIGDVTPTVEIDGVSYPLLTDAGASVISSTGGEKQKIHLWAPPVKGKVYRWILAGIQFRLYGEECEIRVKEFATGLGYQGVNPFA